MSETKAHRELPAQLAPARGARLVQRDWSDRRATPDSLEQLA